MHERVKVREAVPAIERRSAEGKRREVEVSLVFPWCYMGLSFGSRPLVLEM